MILKGVAGPGLTGMRLDEAAKALFPQFSRTKIRKVIDWGGVRIGGEIVRVASRPLKAGETVTLAVTEPDPHVDLSYADSDLLLDDAEYLAVRKAAGVYCQRTPYQLKGTVEYAVGLLLRSQGIAGPARVIHRLDRGTSGVMVFPKTRAAAAHLSRLLATGEVEKVYWAVVDGNPTGERWTVEAPVAPLGKSRFGVAPGGRDAVTDFRVLARGRGSAFLEARPRTGRTHQIRVHLAHCGLPVAGDDRYGGLPAARLLLHCRRMAFRAKDGRTVEAGAPAGEDFVKDCRKRGITVPAA